MPISVSRRQDGSWAKWARGVGGQCLPICGVLAGQGGLVGCLRSPAAESGGVQGSADCPGRCVSGRALGEERPAWGLLWAGPGTETSPLQLCGPVLNHHFKEKIRQGREEEDAWLCRVCLLCVCMCALGCRLVSLVSLYDRSHNLMQNGNYFSIYFLKEFMCDQCYFFFKCLVYSPRKLSGFGICIVGRFLTTEFISLVNMIDTFYIFFFYLVSIL